MPCSTAPARIDVPGRDHGCGQQCLHRTSFERHRRQLGADRERSPVVGSARVRRCGHDEPDDDGVSTARERRARRCSSRVDRRRHHWSLTPIDGRHERAVRGVNWNTAASNGTFMRARVHHRRRGNTFRDVSSRDRHDRQHGADRHGGRAYRRSRAAWRHERLSATASDVGSSVQSVAFERSARDVGPMDLDRALGQRELAVHRQLEHDRHSTRPCSCARSSPMRPAIRSTTPAVEVTVDNTLPDDAGHTDRRVPDRAVVAVVLVHRRRQIRGIGHRSLRPLPETVSLVDSRSRRRATTFVDDFGPTDGSHTYTLDGRRQRRQYLGCVGRLHGLRGFGSGDRADGRLGRRESDESAPAGDVGRTGQPRRRIRHRPLRHLPPRHDGCASARRPVPRRASRTTRSRPTTRTPT